MCCPPLMPTRKDKRSNVLRYVVQHKQIENGSMVSVSDTIVKFMNETTFQNNYFLYPVSLEIFLYLNYIDAKLEL